MLPWGKPECQFDEQIFFNLYYISDRPGSEHDVKCLKKTFGKLSFELFQGKAHIDVTKDEIFRLVKAFAEDPSKLPRFLFVMCHGNESALLDVNMDPFIRMKYLYEHFNSTKAPHLEGILKLIAIQACR